MANIPCSFNFFPGFEIRMNAPSRNASPPPVPNPAPSQILFSGFPMTNGAVCRGFSLLKPFSRMFCRLCT